MSRTLYRWIFGVTLAVIFLIFCFFFYQEKENQNPKIIMMDGFLAAGILKMFFEAINGGIGRAVPELIGLGIPGSEILLAADVLGIDLLNDPKSSNAIKKDPSLQRYLNLKIDNSIDQDLDRDINNNLDF